MNKMKRGFTLVELLVVIGILGILMAVLIPAISNAMFKSKVNTCKIQGKKVFDAIQSAGLSKEDQWYYFPRTNETKSDDNTEIEGKTFNSSYEYFKELMQFDLRGTKQFTSPVEDLDINMLSGCGVPSATAKDFKARNLMWCIAQGVDKAPDVAPVLVTRNAAVDKLITSGEFKGDEKTEVGIGKNNGGTHDEPFGDKTFVIVRKSGSVESIERSQSKLNLIYKKEAFTIDSAADFKYLKVE